MKNSIKLVILTFLMGVSGISLLGMQPNEDPKSLLPRPNLPEQDDIYNPPGSPGTARRALVCPSQKPLHAAAKQAGSAAKQAALHAHWAAHGGPASLNFSATDQNQQDS